VRNLETTLTPTLTATYDVEFTVDCYLHEEPSPPLPTCNVKREIPRLRAAVLPSSSTVRGNLNVKDHVEGL